MKLRSSLGIGNAGRLAGIFMVILLSLLFVSCDHKDLSLKYIEDIVEPSFDREYIDYKYVSNEQSEYLFNWDQKGREIEVANLYSSEIDLRIPLDTMYASFDVYPKYYLPVNKDSIFFFTNFMIPKDELQLTIILLNRTGRVVNSWNLKEIFPGDQPYSLMPVSFSPVIYSKGRLYFQKVLKYSHQNKKSRLMSNSEALELVIDLNQSPPTAVNNSGSYPESYMDGDYLDYYAFRTVDDKMNLIYSFRASHDIQVYNTSGNMGEYDASSKYIKRFNYLDNQAQNMQDAVRKYYRTEPGYKAFYCDPYRGFYYRLVRHRVENAREDGTLTDSRDQGKSIVVLNSEFRKLGEVLLDKNKFRGIIGVCKKGIIMMNAADGKMIYSVYKIEV